MNPVCFACSEAAKAESSMPRQNLFTALSLPDRSIGDSMTLWEVRRVEYATYEEMARTGGDKPARVVMSNLPLDKAKKVVEQLGFGHSAHPMEQI